MHDVLQPHTRRLIAMLALICAIDALVLGSTWLPLHGLADESSHVLTAFIWLTAARGMGLRLRLVPGLVAAVVIDLDHVPDILDLFGPPEGSSRPVTHSLGLVAVVVILAVVDKRRRSLFAGACVGLLSHLLRDLGTGAVILWWPLSSTPVSYPYQVYLAITVAFASVSAWTALPRPEPYRALSRFHSERSVD